MKNYNVPSKQKGDIIKGLKDQVEKLEHRCINLENQVNKWRDAYYSKNTNKG